MIRRRPNYLAWALGILLALAYLRMGAWQQEPVDPDAVADAHAGLIARMLEE
jgi:predicted outer membrane lipoprotein